MIYQVLAGAVKNAKHVQMSGCIAASSLATAFVQRGNEADALNSISRKTIAPLLPTPPIDLASDVAMEDFDDLLNAVTMRLRQSVDNRSEKGPTEHVHRMSKSIKTCVLECATALDQLRATFRHDLRRRQQLEPEKDSA